MMIFDLVQSSLNGKFYARTIDEHYGCESADTDPFELVEMLSNAFPNNNFYVCCFDGYENGVNLN